MPTKSKRQPVQIEQTLRRRSHHSPGAQRVRSLSQQSRDLPGPPEGATQAGEAGGAVTAFLLLVMAITCLNCAHAVRKLDHLKLVITTSDPPARDQPRICARIESRAGRRN
jgi:hypothetical protein